MPKNHEEREQHAAMVSGHTPARAQGCSQRRRLPSADEQIEPDDDDESEAPASLWRCP